MDEFLQKESAEIGDLANDLKLYSENISIIYAEDDPSISNEVVTLLRKFFTNVKICKNGQEAYSTYLEGGCDILITDLAMPQVDGFELLSLVRHLKKDQKVVAISAHDESENMVKLINIEVDAFLPKPIDGRQLLQVLHTLCKELRPLK